MTDAQNFKEMAERASRLVGTEKPNVVIPAAETAYPSRDFLSSHAMMHGEWFNLTQIPGPGDGQVFSISDEPLPIHYSPKEHSLLIKCRDMLRQTNPWWIEPCRFCKSRSTHSETCPFSQLMSELGEYLDD